MSGTGFREYLAGLEERGQEGLDRSPAANALRRVTSHRSRELAKTHLTTLVHPVSRRRLNALIAAADGPLRLNLGSGRRRIPGWLNIDLLGMNSHLPWNLARPLPLPQGSVDAVFLEHTLEHFSVAQGLDIVEGLRPLLRKGGTIRLGVPDFSKYIRGYCTEGALLEELRPGRPLPILAAQEVVFCHGHKSAWDGDLLVRVLTEAGYAGAAVRAYGESRLPEAPDTPDRERESVYAEAVKD